MAGSAVGWCSPLQPFGAGFGFCFVLFSLHNVHLGVGQPYIFFLEVLKFSFSRGKSFPVDVSFLIMA